MVTIRFDDGAAYERYMGKWSQPVGEMFLDWLSPKSGLRWLDVGRGAPRPIAVFRNAEAWCWVGVSLPGGVDSVDSTDGICFVRSVAPS